MIENKSTGTAFTKAAKGYKRGIMARLRRYFLTGILVTAPIGITIYLTWVFLTFIDTRVTALFPADQYGTLYTIKGIPGIGVIVALVFFLVVGWFATNFLGRMVVRFSDYIFYRVPVIGTVYKSVKQVFETLIGSQAQAFREVVMVEFPREGVWTLGFITGVTEGEIQGAMTEELVNVFVPTAPSPVNGFLLFVPRNRIIPLKMAVDEGIKMVVSMGIIQPSAILPAPEEVKIV
jgi:uncharacterized membrane protein